MCEVKWPTLVEALNDGLKRCANGRGHVAQFDDI